MTDHLPHPSPTQLGPIRSQADLHAAWAAVLGELGFSRTTVWVLPLTADGLTTGLIVPIDDVPARPTPGELDRLMDLVVEILHLTGPGSSAAFLASRPGAAGLDGWDRAWARGLATAVARAGLRPWPVHLANDDELRVYAPDDAARSA